VLIEYAFVALLSFEMIPLHKRRDIMAFTVQDFHDLIGILEQHPEWRTDLRRLMLTEELLSLPQITHALAEAQQRTEQRVAELAEAQRRTEQRINRLLGGWLRQATADEGGEAPRGALP
jgi:hypothetical protein